MARFSYTALTESGQQVSGVVDAEAETFALRMLEDKGLFPVTIQGDSTRSESASAGKKLRVRSRDVGLMYGQLGDLIGSGVPMIRSLDSLIKSTVNPGLKSLLREIKSSVADGKTFADALRAYPDVFPPLHTSMIQAGERAAFLDDVLHSLAGFLERLDELRAKVIGALIYPTLLTALGTLVMTGALLFFVPKFEPLLAGAQKPLPTKILFGASALLRGYWYVVPLAAGGLACAAWIALQNPENRRRLEKLRLRLPVVGTALRMVAITRFCRILGTMLANGVPMLAALKISKDATGSVLLADMIAEAAESVRDGKSLSTPLAAGGLIPEQIVAMISVAEESSKLDKVLIQIADTVERRTNQQVDQAVKLIEPMILCMVAVGIGVLALGLLLPIFTMASSLGKS